jgi:hypothetical protein
MATVSVSCLRILTTFLCAATLCMSLSRAVSAQGDETSSTWTISQRFQGSSSSFGQIMKLNTNIAFDVNRHVGFDVGAPYYFVNYASEDGSGGSILKSGIGNLYADLRLSLLRRPINYVSTVTATVPTGDRDKGLSTGHATVDWNNGFYRVFRERIAPYANIGFANTISDTPFFLRPFSTNGIVGHFEAGATLSLSRMAYWGASGYAIVPSGEQTIISKIVETHTETLPARTLPANSRGRGLGLSKETTRVYETVTEVAGKADLTGDHGFSSWLGIGPVKKFDITVGYSRSGRYELDTFFWGLGFRLGPFGTRVR